MIQNADIDIVEVQKLIAEGFADWKIARDLGLKIYRVATIRVELRRKMLAKGPSLMPAEPISTIPSSDVSMLLESIGASWSQCVKAGPDATRRAAHLLESAAQAPGMPSDLATQIRRILRDWSQSQIKAEDLGRYIDSIATQLRGRLVGYGSQPRRSNVAS